MGYGDRRRRAGGEPDQSPLEPQGARSGAPRRERTHWTRLVLPRKARTGSTRPPVSAGQRIVAWGTVKWTPYGPTIQTPEWEPLPKLGSGSQPLSPVPVYPLTQGITQGQLRRWIQWALDHCAVADPLPDLTRRRHGLLSLKEAYESLHRPKALADVEAGRRRLAFDELFAWQLEMAGLPERAGSPRPSSARPKSCLLLLSQPNCPSRSRPPKSGRSLAAQRCSNSRGRLRLSFKAMWVRERALSPLTWPPGRS